MLNSTVSEDPAPDTSTSAQALSRDSAPTGSASTIASHSSLPWATSDGQPPLPLPTTAYDSSTPGPSGLNARAEVSSQQPWHDAAAGPSAKKFKFSEGAEDGKSKILIF